MGSTLVHAVATIIEKHGKFLVLVAFLGAVAALFVVPGAQIQPETVSEAHADDAVPWADSDALGDVVLEREFVILMESDNIYSPDTIRRIRELGNRIALWPNVDRVVHVGNAFRVEKRGRKSRLVRHIPAKEKLTDRDLHRARQALERSPVYGGRLVSWAGTSTMMSVYVRGDATAAESILLQLRETIDAYDGPERLSVFGDTAINAKAKTLMRRDLTLVFPLALGLLFLVLLLFYRSVWYALVPVLCGACSVLYVVACVVLLGHPLGVISLSLIPVILGTACAYGIFLLARVREVRQRWSDALLLRPIILQIALPLFLASVMTIVSFFGLSASGIRTVSALGKAGIFGVGLAAFLTLVVGPAFLDLTLRRGKKPLDSIGRWRRRFARHAEFVASRRRWIIALAVLATAVSAWGVRGLSLDTDVADFFQEETFHHAQQKLDRQHGGAHAVWLEVDTGEDGAVLRKLTLQRLRQLESVLQEESDVVSVWSVLPFLLSTDERSRRPNGRTVVEKANLAPGYTRLGRFYDADRRFFRIKIGTDIHGSAARVDLYSRLEQVAAETLPARYRVRVSGVWVMADRAVQSIVDGQLKSLCAGFALIVFMLLVLLRSFQMTLVAMVPILFPILCLLGIMGCFGIPINHVTLMIVFVTLGISVHDTMHMLIRFYEELRDTPHGRLRRHLGERLTSEQRGAMTTALSQVGGSAVLTCVSLAIAFLALTTSSFIPLTQLGLLAAAGMLICVVADVLILPALLASVRI